MSIAKNLAMALAKASGRFADWEADDVRVSRGEPVPFKGDLPDFAGTEMNQYRLEYCKPRQRTAHADGVTYTSDGMAWIDGKLQRKYSIREVGPRHVWKPRQAAQERYEVASLLQSQTPTTYGDWISEHVASLADAKSRGELVAPLLLPASWYRKSYVQRDLLKLDIEAEPVAQSVFVEHATIINKIRPGHWWTDAEASTFRQVMKIRLETARPGSAIYLSRLGEKGEGPQREINNRVTEAAMETAGVRVVRTVDCTREDYIELAPFAETLFSDHGSAMYNMFYWKTTRIVELYSPTYWEASFLVLSRALGITDYSLWRIEHTADPSALAGRISALLSEPIT